MFYEFCVEMVASTGVMPTRHEVAQQYGYSVHHATDMLKMLCGKGWLRKRYTKGKLTFELREDDVLANGHGGKDAARKGR